MNPLMELAFKRMDSVLGERRTRLNNEHQTPDGVEELLDNTFQGPGGTLAMDIFRPKNPNPGPLPVVIMIHGGGLIMGTRKVSRIFCQNLAAKGFLVFAPEYRLATEADVVSEIEDIFAAFSYVSDYLEGYGGDPDNITVVSDSAGSFLAVYAVAAIGSPVLQRTFGLDKTSLRVGALACFTGMFYTTKRDPLGLFYADAIYGEKMKDQSFMQVMNPESPDVMYHLPPVFLVGSDADILKDYTNRFAAALEDAGHPYELLYYRGNRELDHSFPTLKPDLPESQEVLEKLVEWIERINHPE